MRPGLPRRGVEVADARAGARLDQDGELGGETRWGVERGEKRGEGRGAEDEEGDAARGRRELHDRLRAPPGRWARRRPGGARGRRAGKKNRSLSDE